MFTGLVEAIGTVVDFRNRRLKLTIPDAWPDDPFQPGESVAVSGVCLTVLDPVEPGFLVFDLSEETLARTSLGGLSVGICVNLERAMRASDRFGGHIVQGHVDATARVADISRLAGSVEMRFELEAEGSRLLVDKGSVTVDGVSLTVVAPKGNAFSVSLIPHTLASTTLDFRQVGDVVNLEFDVLAKHVEKLMNPR